MMKDQCEAVGCTEEALVGLNGVSLCLDHLYRHLVAAKARLTAAVAKAKVGA